MEEKDALLPVGNLRALEEAMGDVVRVARVPATMLVSAHGEPMSVPRRCIGRPARIVCMPGGAMDCYVGGELVATHVAGGRCQAIVARAPRQPTPRYALKRERRAPHEDGQLPYIKTLADFELPAELPRGLVEQLATLEFIDRGDNVVLVGSPGVGKTHLSIAIGHEAVMARKQVYRRLLEAGRGPQARLGTPGAQDVSTAACVELGYLDIGKEGADLCSSWSRRYALKRSTIVTTNVPVGRWGAQRHGRWPTRVAR